MPHQCIECGRTFSDGSKEMLSGCPECGGNKFQFRPGGTSEPSTDPTPPTENSSVGLSASSEASAPSEAASSTDTLDPTDTTESPADRSDTSDPTGSSRDTPSGRDATDDTESASDRAAGDAGEDTAQASARSDVVTPDELDRASREVEPSDQDDATEPRPDIDELRDELNEQFESIRIVSPGTYELNLMELYDRQEYIISLQEDGRYVIEMPDAWGVDEE
jgi:Zn-ribbon containing protein